MAEENNSFEEVSFEEVSFGTGSLNDQSEFN